MPNMTSYVDAVATVTPIKPKHRDLSELKKHVTLRAIELMNNHEHMDPWAAFNAAQFEVDTANSLVTRDEVMLIRAEFDAFLKTQRDEVIIRAEKRFVRGV